MDLLNIVSQLAINFFEKQNTQADTRLVARGNKKKDFVTHPITQLMTGLHSFGVWSKLRDGRSCLCNRDKKTEFAYTKTR